MIELTWGTDNDAIRAARDSAIAARLSVAGFDPGKHGCLLVQTADRVMEAFTLGDERRGTWQDAARACARLRVKVFFCEAQYAPTVTPGVHPSVFSAKAASAILCARNAGSVTAMVAGLVDSQYEVVLVWTQPSTWQKWVLEDLPKRPKKEDLKAASVAHAEQRIPKILRGIPRGEDREGAADALGLLAFGLTSPLR